MNNNFIKRLFFYVFAVFILGCNNPKKETSKPLNILWINADDLGKELSCYGNLDVKTPNIDKLAADGVKYINAYANAPVCSASRSSQITGVYPSKINVLNHRTMDKKKLPEGILTVMDVFRKKGYFCSNGWAHNMAKKGKEDYNFLGDKFFDGTDWKVRKEGQPFFAQVQIHEPHRTFKEDTINPINPDSVTLPSSYPNHPLLKADWANYLESVQIADKKVGKILKRLEQEGLADHTIVIFFGDHGRPHLRDKQWLYEGGLAIPLIVRYPKNKNAGTIKKDLISLVDITASSLQFVGIEIPEQMDGKSVLQGDKRDYVLGFRERCGDAVDNIRSITDGEFKLIWNKMPDHPYMQVSSYKKLQYPAFVLYNVLHKQGKLEHPYSLLMAEKRPEFELYHLKNDPDEFKNLINNSEYNLIKNKLTGELKTRLAIIEKNWVQEDTEARERGVKGSQNYFKKSIKKRGLPENPTDEEILKYWEESLLKVKK